MEKDWFTSWFDTPYYHLLYKNRDDADAQFFIKNVVSYLKLPKSARILDLPCGKGRHAVFLNSLGYRVTGGDLSENSIKFAKKSENATLNFEVWDMRVTPEYKYDAVFNLFTSFGYFSDDKDDILVLSNIKKALNPEGYFIFDYLNVEKVKNKLVLEEVKIVEDIEFSITRKIENGFIKKNIVFSDKGQDYNFTEQVKMLDLTKLEDYFGSAGFTIDSVFGDYSLDDFNPETSDRLIIIAR